MSKIFNGDTFREAISQKCPTPQACPFCQGTNFMTYNKISHLQVQDNSDGIVFGQSIPCGVVICGNCGHINLFALSFLDIKP